MKRLSLIFILLACTLTVNAEFELSRNVYKLDDLAVAQADAKKYGKPISFIYSNTSTTCPLTSNVSSEFIDEFDRRTIMIYVDDDNYDDLPSSVRNNLNLKKCGDFMPWFALMDADLKEALITTGYTSFKEDDKATIKAVKKAISNYKK